MNKAKIMLTAIALFAVVGGALAFKTKMTRTIYTTAVFDTPGGAVLAAPTTAVSGVKVYWTNAAGVNATAFSYTIAHQ